MHEQHACGAGSINLSSLIAEPNVLSTIVNHPLVDLQGTLLGLVTVWIRPDASGTTLAYAILHIMSEVDRILDLVVNTITLNEFMRQAIAIDHELYTLRPRVYVFSDELECVSRAIKHRQEKLYSLERSYLGHDVGHTTLAPDSPMYWRLGIILDEVAHTREMCLILTEWLDQAAMATQFRWISVRHALRTVCSKERIDEFSSDTEETVERARTGWYYTALWVL